MISKSEFQNTVEKMLELAATRVPKDVADALKKSENIEKNPIAEKQLRNIIENIELAKEKSIPLCQDTGIPIFFVKIGQRTNLKFDFLKTLEESIKNATKSVPLRPNVVNPLTRKNTGDNTGEKIPQIYFKPQSGESFEIELMLKGAGSENWSRLFMLNPNASKEDIKDKILEVMKEAGGQVCPPVIIGVGIGGTADQACCLAKETLLRSINEKNKDDELFELERVIANSVNELGIGPMGLGGESTTLGVNIEVAGCHTASLPLAVNFQCWAARRSKACLKNGELQIEVPK